MKNNILHFALYALALMIGLLAWWVAVPGLIAILKYSGTDFFSLRMSYSPYPDKLGILVIGVVSAYAYHHIRRGLGIAPLVKSDVFTWLLNTTPQGRAARIAANAARHFLLLHLSILVGFVLWWTVITVASASINAFGDKGLNILASVLSLLIEGAFYALSGFFAVAYHILRVKLSIAPIVAPGFHSKTLNLIASFIAFVAIFAAFGTPLVVTLFLHANAYVSALFMISIIISVIVIAVIGSVQAWLGMRPPTPPRKTA